MAMADAGPERDSSGAAVEARLADWLSRNGQGDCRIDRLAGDVSTRQYFRVRAAPAERSAVAAYYPSELAAAQGRFAAAARLLREAGVRVPAILIDDETSGFALLEDVGVSTLYESGPGWEERPRELAAALDAASRIAALPADEVAALGSPPLDAGLLWRELESTLRLLLAPHSLADPATLAALAELCRRVAEEPLVPCHRDFMARNLIPDGGGGVIVLDFQDLRLAPAAYDLASLLNDSFFAPEELEREVVARRGFRGDREAGYRRAVVQRTLKAAGTYLRFAERGFRRHLPLVAPTVARALPHLAELPETRAVWRREAGAWRRIAASAFESIC